MTSAPSIPELFWMSGSPPSWRVMMALEHKGIPYTSTRLDVAAGDLNKPEHLALNPRGQVPVLRHDGLVVRESVAIIAYLDSVWRDPPLFGASAKETAAVWQSVMDTEINLYPHVTAMARIVFRGSAEARADDLAAAARSLGPELAALNTQSAGARYLAGAQLSAADFVAFPAVQLVRRVLLKDTAPAGLAHDLELCPALAAWEERIRRLPWFEKTYPPHWRS